MKLSRHLSALLALLFTAGSAVGQAQDGDWVSYRDAYRTMVVFDKYGKPKNFIQSQLQVQARDRNAQVEGLQLTVVGKTTRLNLPLDATGRAVFPFNTVAYNENAVLVLNRKVSQYRFRPRVSIVVRPDGVYEAADLRAACEQMLAYERYLFTALGAKKCVGVRFAFVKGEGDPGVRLRKGDVAALPPSDGAAFADDPYEGFRVVNYRFGDSAAKGQVVTENAPLAISAIYE
ncbi:MAG: hypothetical protein V4633_01675 [Pseudomonadota bacterium]